MSDTATALMRRLAGMFGQQPFTTAAALRALDAGLGEPQPSPRTLGNVLRAAAGRTFASGARTITLRQAGIVHGNVARWRFEAVVDGASADPDGDLL